MRTCMHASIIYMSKKLMIHASPLSVYFVTNDSAGRKSAL